MPETGCDLSLYLFVSNISLVFRPLLRGIETKTYHKVVFIFSLVTTPVVSHVKMPLFLYIFSVMKNTRLSQYQNEIVFNLTVIKTLVGLDIKIPSVTPTLPTVENNDIIWSLVQRTCGLCWHYKAIPKVVLCRKHPSYCD